MAWKMIIANVMFKKARQDCICTGIATIYFCFFFFFFFFFWPFSGAAPVAYGGSQARGPIGAVAAGLHQSHSNSGFEPRLGPIPQFTAIPEQGQGWNPKPHGS